MNEARNANPLKGMEKTSKAYNQHKDLVRSTYLFGFIQTSPHGLLEALVVEQLRKSLKTVYQTLYMQNLALEFSTRVVGPANTRERKEN